MWPPALGWRLACVEGCRTNDWLFAGLSSKEMRAFPKEMDGLQWTPLKSRNDGIAKSSTVDWDSKNHPAGTSSSGNLCGLFSPGLMTGGYVN